MRREWWKRYDKRDISSYGTTVVSVDATFKDLDTGDYVAIEVWSKLGNNYYLRYLLNKRMDFPATVQAIRLIKRLFPEALYTLIEDKANGSAIIQTLRSEFVGIIAINPKGGKVARVNSVAPAIESGNVFVPNDEVWAEEFIDQFTQFPAAEHDDMVDSASQALNWMLFSHGGVALPETLDARTERIMEQIEREVFTSGAVYDVYGTDDNIIDVDFYEVI